MGFTGMQILLPSGNEYLCYSQGDGDHSSRLQGFGFSHLSNETLGGQGGLWSDEHLQLGQGEGRTGKTVVYLSCHNPAALLAQPRPREGLLYTQTGFYPPGPILQSTHPLPSVKQTLDRPEDSLPKEKFAAHPLSRGMLG